MNRLLSILLIAVSLSFSMTASAKKMPIPKMYMFGMAASFTDTIVHFTSMQALDSVWIESKNKFLLSRDSYSYQLREYLGTLPEMKQRTCIVVYNKDQKKLQKKYDKMKRLYTQPKKGARKYDVRFIDDADFHFTTIDETPYIEEEEAEQTNKPEVKKEKKKKKKRGK